MSMLRTCEKTVWGLGWPKCVGKLVWVKWEELELACLTAFTCLFKVRPDVLIKTLSHMWGKLNLPVFLFNVGLLTLIKMNSLMFPSLLGYNVKQKDLCRSKLAPIISTPTMNKCQELINKVSEFRYLKVRERQINKFNRLIHKKEGNETWSVPPRALVNSALPAVSVSSPQAGSTSLQAINTASLPRTSNIVSSSQAGNQLNNIRSSQSGNISFSQAGSQLTSSPNSVNNNLQAGNANSQAVSTVSPGS